MTSKGDRKVAIITGGTTGLGAATTTLFARNGYRVLAVSLSDPEHLIAELQKQELQAEFLQTDLSDAKASSVAIIRHAIALWGRIDVVVNCAARISHKELADIEEKDWNDIFAVNLKAPFFMAQAAFPYLAQTRGCIINISSINAWKVNLKNHLYDSLKAGLNHLTKGLALEFRGSGVRVNAIMPGAMSTPLINEWLEVFLGRPSEASDLTQPHIATPDMVAQGILALASEELRWINGVELPIDGGYHLG